MFPLSFLSKTSETSLDNWQTREEGWRAQRWTWLLIMISGPCFGCRSQLGGKVSGWGGWKRSGAALCGLEKGLIFHVCLSIQLKVSHHVFSLFCLSYSIWLKTWWTDCGLVEGDGFPSLLYSYLCLKSLQSCCYPPFWRNINLAFALFDVLKWCDSYTTAHEWPQIKA